MTFPESTLAQTESGPCTNTTGFGAGTDDVIVNLKQKVDFCDINLADECMYLVSGCITSSNTHKYTFNYAQCKTDVKDSFLDVICNFSHSVSFCRIGLVS